MQFWQAVLEDSEVTRMLHHDAAEFGVASTLWQVRTRRRCALGHWWIPAVV